MTLEAGIERGPGDVDRPSGPDIGRPSPDAHVEAPQTGQAGAQDSTQEALPPENVEKVQPVQDVQHVARDTDGGDDDDQSESSDGKSKHADGNESVTSQLSQEDFYQDVKETC